jgi:hypothetical protein
MSTFARAVELKTGNQELGAALFEFFKAFVRYQNLKDMNGVLGCIHMNSDWRVTMQKAFEGLFDNYTLDVSILEHVYGGTDGEYAYYRVTQTIKKVAGPEFRDIQAENLVVFRRSGEEWKVWNCFPLRIEAL